MNNNTGSGFPLPVLYWPATSKGFDLVIEKKMVNKAAQECIDSANKLNQEFVCACNGKTANLQVVSKDGKSI